MMSSLPWLLLLIGIVIIAAVYVYTRYQSTHKDDVMSNTARSSRDISEEETLKVNVLPQHHSVPTLTADDAKESDREETLLILNICARDKDEWSGEKIIQCAFHAGLECGDRKVFEYYGDKDGERSSKPIFYVANFVNPGTFEWENISQFKTKGMSLFMRLPGPGSALNGFEKMLACCKDMAAKLNADILDSERVPLTDKRLQEMRKICQNFDTE